MLKRCPPPRERRLGLSGRWPLPCVGAHRDLVISQSTTACTVPSPPAASMRAVISLVHCAGACLRSP
jgi:hypothetical protein